MIKKLLIALLLPSLVLIGLISQSHRVYAAFNANNLIGDGVFDNANSMTSAQIDSWLNNYFPSSCISTSHGFTAPDPTGYSPNPSQFFYGSAVSAGTVIYDAAQAYGINPQVLLVTLEKEESLVSGGSGCATWQYTSAVGYGCTDSGTNTHDYSYPGGGLVTPLYYLNGNPINSISGSCVNSGPKAGFSEQVIHAAWLLTFSRHKSEGDTGWAVIKGNWDNCDDNNTCPAAWNIPASDACYSGFMTQGSFKRCPTDSTAIFYDGYATIDGSSTHMDTGATAAFYVYTPHFHGNQVFDDLFSSWFGPLDIQYGWSLQNVTYSTNQNAFGGGVPGTVTVTVTNTSSVPWYNYGNNPVRLGTWLPGRSSPLYSPGWLSASRLANMNENQVAPGGTATFTVPINTNNLGTYVDAWNLVVENSQWMPWQGLSPTISIKPAYQWQVSSVSYSAGTGLMVPKTTQQVTIVAKNTGFTTWSSTSGPQVRLGTWLPGRVSSVAYNWISATRAATMNEVSVAPGQTGTFQFTVSPPSTGLFYERMNLVAEGQAWFNDAGLTLYLAGGAYSWKPLWISPSTGNWNIPHGTTFTITLQAKNIGNLTWYRDTSFPIRLATDDPQDRGSALYTPSWISPTRVTGLVQDTVPPGAEGTFTFTAVSPSATGSRFEGFNLVAEGVLWFNDPGFGFTIKSL